MAMNSGMLRGVALAGLMGVTALCGCKTKEQAAVDQAKAQAASSGQAQQVQYIDQERRHCDDDGAATGGRADAAGEHGHYAAGAGTEANSHESCGDRGGSGTTSGFCFCCAFCGDANQCV